MRNEVREVVRKFGREEVLAAIMEGLTQYEQASLLRSVAIPRHFALLLALTGEEFKQFGPDAIVVSSRFGHGSIEGPRKQRSLRGKPKGFEQAFSVNFDVVFTSPHVRESIMLTRSDPPDVYIDPSISPEAIRRLSE